MRNLLLILAFTFGFSLFDYFAYNIAKNKGWTNGLLAPYRIVQGAVQIILTAIAWYFCGIIVAVGFTILWWTWNCDWLYYLIDYLAEKIFKKSYEQGKGLANVMNNKCNWAWWSLYFLIFKNGWSNRTQIAKWYELLIQSTIGIITVTLIIRHYV